MVLERSRRSLLVRALNTGGRLLQRPGRPLARLDEDWLISEARRQTGLSDFGDLGLEEPLRILMRAYNTEARLNFAGRIAARHDTLRLLTNRLRLEADRERHPEIAAQQIRQPLFIVGLPRTGTTLLHNLLAQDPDNRVPMSWEVMFPSPPPERAFYYSDPRIARAGRLMNGLDWLAPGFKAIHPVSASLPQECIAIMSHAFISFQFQTTHNVPTYQAWLDRQDLAPAYAFHRRFLQHLQWRCPAQRWVLKAPAHLFGIEALLSAYPDAGIIQTHRDPFKVMGSLASLTSVLRGAFSDHVDPLKIGAEMTHRWTKGLEFALAARDGNPATNRRFFDVRYDEFVQDPLATVRGIYSHFGLKFSDRAEARMRRFLEVNPRGKHGAHSYSLAQFGLRLEDWIDHYRAYCKRFGIEPDFQSSIT